MVRKIVFPVPADVLQKDLERYRQRAIELGATDAKVITTDMVVVDERVRAKCTYPKCRYWGTNANCPPHAMAPETTQKVVHGFQWAVFYCIKVPSEEVAGPAVLEQRLSRPSQVKNQEIASKLEAEAFYDGYPLALAFSGGSCKYAFCPDVDCRALVPGQSCRHPLMARSSMEAVGLNAFFMAARVGWDVYPIGKGVDPSDVPHGLKMGIVFVY